MAENYTLYSELYDSLPSEQMMDLVPGIAPKISLTERGRTYVYAWPDLTIVCSEMPSGEVQKHLDGFDGYVRHVYGGTVDSRGLQLIDRIHRSRLVVGVEVEPERDDSGRTEELVGSLCGGLIPLVFFENAIYDSNSQLLLGPDGTFDGDAEINE